jgi:branched-chain amino acid transport system ATP-binding protein
MTSPLLEAIALESGYGRTQVLHKLSLAVPNGARVGIFGPNGHGKTTLLKTISGLLRCRAGEIRFDGERIDNWPPHRIVERGVIHVPQGNTLFPRMTVSDTLSLGAYARRARPYAKSNLDRVFSVFPRLAERRAQLCGTLSGGERQMLSIAMGVMSAPRLLIFDEPTLGLSPRLKDDLRQAISSLTAHGLPLVIVEQDAEFLTNVADHLFMLEHGRVVLEIPPGRRIDHEKIMALYFGQSLESPEAVERL